MTAPWMGFPLAALLGASAATDAAEKASAPPRAAPALTRVTYRIDVPRSRFVVNTETSGMPSMFGHDHKIEIGNYSGDVTLVQGAPATAQLQLSVWADSLHAVEESHEDLSWEIDAALREEVLETQKYPTITFKSHAVTATPSQDGTFDVRLTGELQLHGVRRKMTVPLKLSFQQDSLRATGTFALRQRDFKIAPFSFADGAVTVANRVTISFTIVARLTSP